MNKERNISRNKVMIGDKRQPDLGEDLGRQPTVDGGATADVNHHDQELDKVKGQEDCVGRQTITDDGANSINNDVVPDNKNATNIKYNDVFDKNKKRIKISNLKVTDIKTNGRVIPPRPASGPEEVEIAVMKNEAS